jgi:hypothetical protein
MGLAGERICPSFLARRVFPHPERGSTDLQEEEEEEEPWWYRYEIPERLLILKK